MANEKENVKTLKKERADLLAKLESMNIDNLNKSVAPSMSSGGEKELRNKIRLTWEAYWQHHQREGTFPKVL